MNNFNSHLISIDDSGSDEDNIEILMFNNSTINGFNNIEDDIEDRYMEEYIFNSSIKSQSCNTKNCKVVNFIDDIKCSLCETKYCHDCIKFCSLCRYKCCLKCSVVKEMPYERIIDGRTRMIGHYVNPAEFPKKITCYNYMILCNICAEQNHNINIYYKTIEYFKKMNILQLYHRFCYICEEYQFKNEKTNPENNKKIQNYYVKHNFPDDGEKKGKEFHLCPKCCKLLKQYEHFILFYNYQNRLTTGTIDSAIIIKIKLKRPSCSKLTKPIYTNMFNNIFSKDVGNIIMKYFSYYREIPIMPNRPNDKKLYG